MSGFDEARRRGVQGDLLRQVAKRPVDLLSFEEVREGWKLRHLVDRGIREVPLDRIVGSLGRIGEFNRAFRPRDEALRARWEEVKGLAEGPRGFPPVELYQVGGVYFVVDGHHRVSVARTLGAPAIEARVQEFVTPVPLDVDATRQDVREKNDFASFLAATGLTPESPDEFRTTLDDGYERLIEHIRVHGYYQGIETRRDLPWSEEVASWRDTVYRPIVEILRGSGLLEQFPGRTKTDLYLFTMDHLHHLRQERHDPALPPETAVEELEAEAVPKGWRGWLGWLGRLRGGWRRR